LEGNQSAGYSFADVVQATAERPQKRPVGYESSLTLRHVATLLTAVQRLISFGLFLHFLPPFPSCNGKKHLLHQHIPLAIVSLTAVSFQTISHRVQKAAKLGVAFNNT
jgi:hypothetical protein